ncbi:MAG: protoporphyrinogen oxidase [Betaproteobacteria bacterium]|nr:protoporphyrinogen oxidase [Betaproteobacteria bacterium]
MATVVVIGAGISGLTAAHALAKAGHEVTVLEQSGRPGGRIHSERVAGFLMEHGPNAMISPVSATEALIDDLGIAEEKVFRGDAARNRCLVRDGRVHTLPPQPGRFLLSNFLSLPGRLRMLMEPFVPAEHRDETVADFVRRRLGCEFLDYVINPLVGGIHAGDPDRLSASAVFPQLKRLERESGSIIGGAIKSRLRGKGTAGARCPGNGGLFSFRQGLDTLPLALAKRLRDRVFLGCRVEGVQPRAGGGFRVRVRDHRDTRAIIAHSVVVALPAYATARILQHLDRRVAETLSEIGHPPLAVVFLGYRSSSVSHPLDAIGLLAPAAERRKVLGILFSSTLFSGRAPTGHVAFTAFVGGARQPGLAMLAPNEIGDLVHAEVSDLLGARVRPRLVRVRYWRHGLPQPDLAHAQRLSRIQALETEYPGLFLTGNYFSGPSCRTCVESAVATARRAESYLAEFQAPRSAPAAVFRWGRVRSRE